MTNFETSEPSRLNRTLGLPMLTFYGTGMILGAGIYSVIGKAAGIAGENLWQGFILAAVTALLTALSYAELVTMYPSAGGEYIYLRKAFPRHEWIAAIIGITVVFAGCASAATVALSFSSYLQHFIETPLLLMSASVLIFFTGINIIGIKQSSLMNALFTLIEISGLILFIGLGWQNPEFGAALLKVPNISVFSTAALVFFAYLGFENIVNLAEETKEPEKTIPRAIFLSLIISTILYILVSLSAVALMPPELLAQSDSALTDAAMNSSYRIAGILGGIALFSTANTVLISLITTSRILYGISRNNSLPQIISKTSIKQKTPWVAALISLVVSILLLPFGKVETLAGIASFTIMIAFIMVNVALIILRKTQPTHPRPFRVPISNLKIPALPAIAIATCIVFLFQFAKNIYTTGLLNLIISAAIYFSFRWFKKLK